MTVPVAGRGQPLRVRPAARRRHRPRRPDRRPAGRAAARGAAGRGARDRVPARHPQPRPGDRARPRPGDRLVRRRPAAGRGCRGTHRRPQPTAQRHPRRRAAHGPGRQAHDLPQDGAGRRRPDQRRAVPDRAAAARRGRRRRHRPADPPLRVRGRRGGAGGRADPVAEGVPVLAAELAWGVLAEGALSAEDLLERRTRLSLVDAWHEAAPPCCRSGSSRRAVPELVPPGWPDEVLPPQAPDWQRSAIAWLFDLCPPDYRALRRAAPPSGRAGPVRPGPRGVRASRRPARACARCARTSRTSSPPEAVEAAIGAYDREGRRLVQTGRQVAMVEAALRGERWVPAALDWSAVSLLESVTGPDDLKRLTPEQVVQLAAELRDFMISSVSITGGHLGPSLGVVEITLALHRVFDSPRDRVLWDTGHQAYVHKLVTGRQDGLRPAAQGGRPVRLPLARGVRARRHREQPRVDGAVVRRRAVEGLRAARREAARRRRRRRRRAHRRHVLGGAEQHRGRRTCRS